MPAPLGAVRVLTPQSCVSPAPSRSHRELVSWTVLATARRHPVELTAAKAERIEFHLFADVI